MISTNSPECWLVQGQYRIDIQLQYIKMDKKPDMTSNGIRLCCQEEEGCLSLLLLPFRAIFPHHDWRRQMANLWSQ